MMSAQRLRRAQRDPGEANPDHAQGQVGGGIINIASLAGRRGISPLGGYSATKFAMVGLTEALRMDLLGSGIRVSLVMPGVIDTPMARNALKHDTLKGVPPMMVMLARW